MATKDKSDEKSVVKQARRFPEKGKEKGISERIADKFGKTAEDRARQIMALIPMVTGTGIVGRTLIGNFPKTLGISSIIDAGKYVRLPRSARPQKKKEGGSVTFSEGGDSSSRGTGAALTGRNFRGVF